MKKAYFGFSDIHCHILPGLDDGAKDFAVSLAMARQFEHAGFKRIIATPHFIPGTAWSASKKTVLNAVSTLRTRLQEEGIALDVYPGMEIAIHPQVMNNIKRGFLLPLANSNLFLLEPSFSSGFHDILKAVEECRTDGIDIVLAHPERIPALQRHPKRFLELLEMEIYFQVNISSLLGHLGRNSEQSARYLLEHDAIYFFASDAHNSSIRKPPATEDLYRLETEYGINLKKLFTKHTFNIFNFEDMNDTRYNKMSRVNAGLRMVSY